MPNVKTPKLMFCTDVGFVHDRFSIFSLVTSQIIKSTKGKVVIIQLQASGKSIISMHVSKILFFDEVGVCLIDSGTEHVSSSIQKLHIVQIGRTVSKLFCNPFHSIYVRISYFKVWFRWEILLPTPECHDSCGRLDAV